MSTELGRSNLIILVGVVFFTMFMNGLDSSITNVALPEMGTVFDVDIATVSWVSVIYLMVLACSLMVFAKIAADTGVKRVLPFGIAVFTIGSLMCAISPTYWFLIFSRAIQAIGGAALAATAPMVCTIYMPPSRLGFSLSILTVGTGFGYAIGPFVGGLIMEYSTWHLIFLINIPVGMLCVPLLMKALRDETVGRLVDFDYLGAGFLCTAIFMGILSLELLPHAGMWVFAVMSGISCSALLLLFILAEWGAENPLLNMKMLLHFDFIVLFLCLAGMNLAYTGATYLLPFFGEVYLDMSALEMGEYLLAGAMVTTILGIPIARLSDRRGRKVFCACAGMIMGLVFLLYYILADGMSRTALLILLLGIGLGWAFVGGPMGSRLVEHAREERNMASSLTNMAYNIGGVSGAALASLIFTTFSDSIGMDIFDVPDENFIAGFEPAMLFLALCALAVGALALIVKDRKRKVTIEPIFGEHRVEGELVIEDLPGPGRHHHI